MRRSNFPENVKRRQRKALEQVERRIKAMESGQGSRKHGVTAKGLERAKEEQATLKHRIGIL